MPTPQNATGDAAMRVLPDHSGGHYYYFFIWPFWRSLLLKMRKLSLSAVLAVILGLLVYVAWPYLFPAGSCAHLRTVDLVAADGALYSFCADCGCGMPALTSGVSGGRFWLLLLVVIIVVYFIVKKVQDGKG